jgi:hypothetical protein
MQIAAKEEHQLGGSKRAIAASNEMYFQAFCHRRFLSVCQLLYNGLLDYGGATYPGIEAPADFFRNSL